MKEMTNPNPLVGANKKHRYFAEAVRKTIVKEIDDGLSKAEASRKYGVSHATIFKWVAKYSPKYKASLVTVVEDASATNKVKELQSELTKVYALLGRKSAEVTFLDSVIVLANEQYGTDLKKSFATPPCAGYSAKGNKTN